MSALWSDDARFRLWLEVETAVLEALVVQGKAPQAALDAVRQKANFNTERVLEIESKVKHDVIAFLTNVAEYVGEEARWLHLGMTSSDLLDTVFSIQLCRATTMIDQGVTELLSAVAKQAKEHKFTPCIGRSHGIHAEPTTFGLKMANWYAELSRQQERVRRAGAEMAVGAISGPVGTFAYLDPSVEQFVCDKFGLTPDPVSTQIIQRDRHAALFSAYAGLATTLERICVEVRHLQRTEVREAEEFFSKGQKGSSSMPHKRNPVLSENVSGLARLIRSYAQAALENMPLWHERDISHSSVERVIAPDATIALDFMVARVRNIVDNLLVYPENMKANLELTNGLVYSGTLLVELAKKGLSREGAYALVQQHAMATWELFNVGKQGPSFAERVMGDAEMKKVLTEQELREVFSLERHTAHVEQVFQRVFPQA
jgi:adenylosuccinate lyase